MSKQIKNINPDMPIVVLSAHNESNYLIELIELGIDNFLTKPLNSDALFNTLYKVVEQIYNKIQIEHYKRGLEDLNKLLQEKVKLQKNVIDDSNYMLHEYQDAIDSSSLIIKLDQTGKVTHCNKNFISRSGLAQDDLLGLDFLQLFSHVQQSTKDGIQDAFNERKSFQDDLSIIKKDLRPLHLFLNMIPIKNQQGDLIEYLLLFQDIDAMQQKTQQEFNSIAHKAASVTDEHLLEMMPTPALITDNAFHILHYNRSFHLLCQHLEDPMALLKLEDTKMPFYEVLDCEDRICEKQFDESFLCDVKKLSSCKFELEMATGSCEVFMKMKRKDKDSFLILLIFEEEESCFQL